MNWSDAAGVFDYWRSSGSFRPTWNQPLPFRRFWDRAIGPKATLHDKELRAARLVSGSFHRARRDCA
jgi:hypothetical protein